MKPESIIATYTQDVDCCGTGVYNGLTIEIIDGGGGHYVLLKTDRWALDVDDLPELVQEVKRLLGEVKK